MGFLSLRQRIPRAEKKKKKKRIHMKSYNNSFGSEIVQAIILHSVINLATVRTNKPLEANGKTRLSI